MINTVFPNITTLTTIDIIFGTFLSENKFLSFLIIAAKHHIHCCYWSNKTPNFQNFKVRLHQYENIERIKATQNDAINSHNIKWETFIEHYGTL